MGAGGGGGDQAERTTDIYLHAPIRMSLFQNKKMITSHDSLNWCRGKDVALRFMAVSNESKEVATLRRKIGLTQTFGCVMVWTAGNFPKHTNRANSLGISTCCICRSESAKQYQPIAAVNLYGLGVRVRKPQPP